MSDDFLASLDAAVDNGGTLPDAAPVNNDVATDVAANTGAIEKSQQKPQEVKPEVKTPSSVADELSAMFEDSDPYAEKKEPVEEKKEEQPKKEEASSKDDKEQKQQQQPRNKKKTQEKLLDTFLSEDADGNLVNNEGEVIALAGKSRTYYEGLKNEGRKQRKAATDLALQNIELSKKFKELYDEFKGLEQNATSPLQRIVTDTGFSESEAGEALKIMQQYKKDPIAAIKNMLTQAKMAGIDISKIGANISVDPAQMRETFQTMLDERLAPLSEKTQKDTAQQDAEEQATQFLHEYPDAAPFVQQIGQAKQKFPNMSLQEIWLRLSQELQKHEPKNSKQNSTKYRRSNAQVTETRQPRTRQQPRVTPPQRDYSTMSFEEIAASIVKDNTQ